MNWSHWIRQVHRQVSVIFVLTVIANFVFIGMGKTPPAYVTYAPLLPLAFLSFTGIYMFILPYVAKGRRADSGA